MTTKIELENKFRNGERPSQGDFKDVFDSFIHKEEDGLNVDEEGNVQFNGGVQLSDNNYDELGALRFHNNTVQYYSGSGPDNGWENIASGSGGAFQPVDSSTAVAYPAGNVGIGDFAAAPTYRLEVNLGQNTGEAERVRFGNVACYNGLAAFSGYAYFSNRNRINNDDFALRQGPNGDVQLNARDGQPLSIMQRGDLTRFGISASTGNVIVGAASDLLGASGYAFQVNGSAYKTDGGDNWNVLSDARVKENVHDLEAGLEELMRVRPVSFRYNGKGGTPLGKKGVGIIGQEIEQVFPEMVDQVDGGKEFDHENLRIYNGSALTYVLVNAVKQLAEQVQELKQTLAGSQNTEENKED